MPAFFGEFYGYREGDLEKPKGSGIIFPMGYTRLYPPRVPPPMPLIRLKWWMLDLIETPPYLYRSFSGVALDDYGERFEVGFDSRIVLGLTEDNNLMVKLFYGVSMYEQQERELKLGFFNLESARAFQVKNAEPGLTASYKIVFMG